MNIVEIENEKNHIVKKYQELARNARYRLGELGIKVLSILIAQIKVSDTEFQEYAIKIEDIKKLAGDSKTKNTKHYVDVVTDDLMSKPFWIERERFNWVTYARWEEGSNLIVFEMHRKLKPYLLQLQKNFLQYDINNILLLKSAYVIRLYELCKDHYTESIRYNPKQKTVQFELKIDRMRELFEIPASYQYSSGIKLRILDKAVNQFKEKTDIQISYTEQKIGKKVDRIIIKVKENNRGSNDFLKTEKLFISYMRKHFVNQDLITTNDKHTGKKRTISISPKGHLYDKRSTQKIDALRSEEMWATLYRLAQKNRLEILQKEKK